MPPNQSAVLVGQEKMAKRGPTIRKIDANQHAIVKALRAVGVSVALTSSIGQGCVDCFAGFDRNGHKECIAIEIKAPGGKLTLDELDWQARWHGPYAIVHSVEEALDLIK